MTKKFFSTIVAVAIFVGVFGLLRFANAAEDSPDTTTDVGNQAPIITTTPSDGGSNSGTDVGDPTTSGSNITFTVTAKDVNTDQYYGAFCSTDAITVGDNAAPTCATDRTWAVSAATNSDAQASVTYTTGSNTTAEGTEVDCVSAEECRWFAFVCDKVASSAICFPGNGSGDQGSAIGTVTFADVPADQAQVTVDGVIYEFDLTDGATCGNAVAEDVCMNASSAEDGADAAALLVASDTGGDTGATMYARGAVVYIYADTAGVAGNSLGVTETDDTGNDITPVDTAGGDDDNATPFAINHAPDVTSYAVGDTSGSGSGHATGTIEPGDTVYFTLLVTDADVEDAQDEVTMYVCADGDTYVAGTGCSGTEICTDTITSPSTYMECSSATIASVPTANATYDVEVFIEDQHQLQGTYVADGGTAARQYTVTDVAPYLDTSYGTGGYTATDVPGPAAGGDDTIDFSFGIKDDNGDYDITAAAGVFFLAPETSGCDADENDCYYDTECTLSSVSISSPGSGKLADGNDNAAVATCQVTIHFNALPGGWDVAGFATDAADEVTFADAGATAVLVNPSLQGIDVVQTEIAYSTVAIGGTSSGIETSIGNVGNIVIDTQITGTQMCTDYSTCAGDTIPALQQKWHHTLSTFDWDDSGTGPGPWTLVGSATADPDGGCANRDIAVRETSTATTTNESVYWKIRIPAAQASGSYTGSNTFTSTADSTCSGTEYDN